MKLQKLVYYAYGWCLALKDKPLFTEGVQAWSYGPVVPSLYYEFRAYGTEPITGRAVGTDCEPLRVYDWDDESEFVRALIRKIWAVYGKYTAIELSNATHQPGTPWQKTVELHGGAIPKAILIDDKVIQAYFIGQIQTAA
jgi:uncharacterized phage-associated protein